MTGISAERASAHRSLAIVVCPDVGGTFRPVRRKLSGLSVAVRA